MTGPFYVKKKGQFVVCEGCMQCSFRVHVDKDNPDGTKKISDECLLIPCPFIKYTSEDDPIFQKKEND